MGHFAAKKDQQEAENRGMREQKIANWGYHCVTNFFYGLK